MANRKIRPIRVEGNDAFLTLSTGHICTIDACDVGLVENHNWSSRLSGKTIYAYRMERRKDIRLHRLILIAPSGLQVDHIDGDGLNNRRSNLRLASMAENQRNAGRRIDNKSGFKGVSRANRTGKWRACISVNGRNRHLGNFDTPEGAHAAYIKAATQLHGDFANFG